MAFLDDVYESKWMRASDLRDEPGTFTFERVEVGTVGQGADAKKQFIATFREFDKPLGLNKTNAGAIGDIYGKDTDDWIGEVVVLFPTQVDYQGQMVDAIRVNKRKTLEMYQAKLRAQKQAAQKQPAATRAATRRDVAEAEAEVIGGDSDPLDDIPF